jgi:hypothetical protein
MALKPNQLKDKSIREAYRKAVDEKKQIVGLKDVANIIRAAMDAEWYSFFETLAYKLGV